MNALVIGVAFTDIKGFPFHEYIPTGTNHGCVTTTHGGVARNVAENLANLGVNVNFPLLLDNNALGNEIKGRLEGAGVDLSDAVIVDNAGVGIWLAVFNEKGDLAGSISQMPDVEPLNEMLRGKGEELVKKADFVVCEFDTSEYIAERTVELAEKYGKPVYVIVGNMNIILARRDLMARTRCMIMNNVEAGRLFETDLLGLSPEETLDVVLRRGQELGLRAATVTLGARGCVYADFQTGESGVLPAENCRVEDTTGAGDAFFSAQVTALSMGASLPDSCRKGSRMAALVLGTTESACPKVGMDFFR